VARDAGVGRTLGYVVLDQLEKMGLVEKHDDKSVTLFTAAHPLKLQENAEKQKAMAEKAVAAVEMALPELSSAFRLASGKPGIEFFEGDVGVARVLNDTLSSKEEIYAYIDTESVAAHADEINRDYVRRRLAKGVHKKMIYPNTPIARERAQANTSPFTEIRLATASKTMPFHAVMEIYDNKIAYITFAKGTPTATVIHDRELYTMQRFFFEALWQKAEQV
jgi:sugar-specific transcriptional regulator TrmB